MHRNSQPVNSLNVIRLFFAREPLEVRRKQSIFDLAAAVIFEVFFEGNVF
jgi:hypothetical protein